MNQELPIYHYLNERLAQCGIDPSKNRRPVEDMDGRVGEYPILSANEQEDAIGITYTYIDGTVIQYEDGKKLKDFERLRFREPKEYTDQDGKPKKMRYKQPAGTPIYPYFPPKLVEMYKQKVSKKRGRPIDCKTLYVVEGEFKALCACNKLGLPFVGIGGIHNYKAADGSYSLNESLGNAIQVLAPQNIVLLFDADCLQVVYDKKKDLSQRLRSFYTAMMRFRELIKPYPVDFYFAHVQTKFLQIAKGIDDLINCPEVDRDIVREELASLSTGRKTYVNVMYVDPGNAKGMRRYFAIDSVSNFYEAYSGVIGEQVFNYGGRFWSFDGDKIQSSMQSEIERFIVVGDSYYKEKVGIPRYEGAEPDIEYIKTQKERVKLDLNYDRDALLKIPRFDFFCVEPDNTENYQRIIVSESNGKKTTYFNNYKQITHVPIPGSWENTKKLLRHIFSEPNLHGDDMFEFALDFVQRLFYSPKDKLPILVLASNERNTGKTTFLKWINQIFQRNALLIGNNGFNTQFTTLYAEKLVLCFDEEIQGIDKAAVQEYLKFLTTSDELKYEPKGVDPVMVDNNLHLMMATNKASNFVHISGDENRWAIFRVPPLTADDPDLLYKCIREIPYFLYYLRDREYKYPTRQSRFYFSPKVYETQSLVNVRRTTENFFVKEFNAYMVEYFMIHSLSECELSAVDIMNGMKETSKLRTSKSEIADYLRNEKKKKPSETVKRYKVYHMKFDPISATEISDSYSKTGIPYYFTRDEFINEQEKEQ